MAEIQEVASGAVHVLEPDMLVGRAASCALRIEHRHVSVRHAHLRWDGDRWLLKDLGSTNGTFLNGERINAGREHPIMLGATLAFGRPDCAFRVIQESAPRAMVVPLHGGKPLIVEGELLPLPSAQDPQATIYRRTDGVWVLEVPGEPILTLRNGQAFLVVGCHYRFSSVDASTKTSIFEVTDVPLRHVALLFSVSLDEETVQLHARVAGKVHDLGMRGHNYLLLTLARRRMADAGEGVAETEAGWIYQEELAHDPSMFGPQLNVDVFRIRRAFSAMAVLDPASIVERRPRTRQLRIGTGLLEIARQ